ncbi:hypothetical protein K492DRAFT_240109 [Lichtheimia hyalospora FSU 10163]|nr:hypothetical protein K492DRAFT_240109 [Lichtheimia hyalospora FSU 10163]
MLRVYSVMQLEHVWAKPMDVIIEEPQKVITTPSDATAKLSTVSLSPSAPVMIHEEPESFEDVLSAGASPISDDEHVHSDVESSVNEETMNTTCAVCHNHTSSSSTSTSIKDVIEPVSIPQTCEQDDEIIEIKQDKAETPVVEEPVAVRNYMPIKNEDYIKEQLPPSPVDSRYSSKRDSKISTSSSPLSSIAEERKSLSGKVASILSRTRSHKSNTLEEHAGGSMEENIPQLPPLSMPPMPKPSKSAQIQAKVSAQRKRLSRTIKRTFSVHSNSSSTAAKNKRATL